MAQLKSVGVREFRDHVTTYPSGSAPGRRQQARRGDRFLYPGRTGPGASQASPGTTRATVERVLADAGLSEEELRLVRPAPSLRMIIVVDASVLVSELLRKRGRELLRPPDLRRVWPRSSGGSRARVERRVSAIVAQGRLTANRPGCCKKRSATWSKLERSKSSPVPPMSTGSGRSPASPP